MFLKDNEVAAGYGGHPQKCDICDRFFQHTDPEYTPEWKAALVVFVSMIAFAAFVVWAKWSGLDQGYDMGYKRATEQALESKINVTILCSAKTRICGLKEVDKPNMDMTVNMKWTD